MPRARNPALRRGPRSGKKARYQQVLELRIAGMKVSEIEARLGLTRVQVNNALFDARRAGCDVPYQLKRTNDTPSYVIVAAPISDAERRRRIRLIPDDTRDLTARFCGDPLPGRSALDMRPA